MFRYRGQLSSYQGRIADGLNSGKAVRNNLFHSFWQKPFVLHLQDHRQHHWSPFNALLKKPFKCLTNNLAQLFTIR